MPILSLLFLTLLSALSIVAMEPDLSSSTIKAVKVIEHAIGQGNFITVEFPSKVESQNSYIVVDCGSGSYHHELEHIKKRSQEEEAPLTIEKFLQDKRLDIFGVNNKKPLNILGLILTHPDSDHINQIDKLFNYKIDRIDYIICGGLPEMYQKAHMDFEQWINRFIKRGSYVYFPAISYHPIQKFRKILPIHLESYQPYDTWAERKFTAEDYTDHPFPDLIKALTAINEDLRLYFLAVNPTHATGPGGTVRLTNAIEKREKEKETNTDSLVLKIAYGQGSIILPGDATGITTSRIQSTYSAPFLKSPVLLLAHHGASTDGSNNDTWLNLIQPEYVLISAGHTYGHPSKEAFKRFHSLASLKKRVTSHRVSWSAKKKSNKRDHRDTTVAIFLTYESGDLITEIFMDGQIKLTTQIEGTIQEQDEEEPSVSSSSDEDEREPFSSSASEGEPQSSASTESRKKLRRDKPSSDS